MVRIRVNRQTDGFLIDIRSGTVSTNADAIERVNVVIQLTVNDNALAITTPPAPATPSIASPQLLARVTTPSDISGTATPLSSDPPALRVVLLEKTGPTRQISENTFDDEIPWRINKSRRLNWERIGPSATTARKSTFNRYPKQTARKSTFKMSTPD